MSSEFTLSYNLKVFVYPTLDSYLTCNLDSRLSLLFLPRKGRKRRESLESRLPNLEYRRISGERALTIPSSVHSRGNKCQLTTKSGTEPAMFVFLKLLSNFTYFLARLLSEYSR